MTNYELCYSVFIDQTQEMDAPDWCDLLGISAERFKEMLAADDGSLDVLTEEVFKMRYDQMTWEDKTAYAEMYSPEPVC